ncbi:MAG: 1-deoxy-D-xylulose-5-phosphate synthase [Lachnospiraceae bacterium]|nr:1-deoxy-D-xylulose-5-phosphate synthase [Lachnospiraceae bacterium]
MEYEILSRLKEANDIYNLDEKEYKKLADEIRGFLMEKVSFTGGHLASNLGVVELTMALHLSLHFPKDKLVWDVGHQSYTHMILTGRQEGFEHLRQLKGMSGFPKARENECDAFSTGHSSTSISAAVGLAKARDIKGSDETIVAVIGDGALSGGMAFEALNNAARLKSNLIIVLNDNNMSITENVGGMANYLGKIRTGAKYRSFKDGVENALHKVPKVGDSVAYHLKRSKDTLKSLFVQEMLFEDMGITYLGPIDGHNVGDLCKAFQYAKRMNSAVLVHVITKKGKGYTPAEKNPASYHGVDPFDIKKGIRNKTRKTTYTQVFGGKLLELAEKDEKITAVCAAMPSGTGLMRFREQFPDRFFDVGIAEEHAVTFAAGMAAGGLKPVVAIYSTFLQRAYDQIIHDVCMDKWPVVFAVDRAGLVGNDGETHQGIFDLSYMNTIPNLTIMAPKNANELEHMLEAAFDMNCPVAIRYPRGEAYVGLEDFHAPIQYGKSELIYRKSGIAILAIGSMVKTGYEVYQKLKEAGICATLVNARFVKPLDTVLLDELTKEHSLFVTMEENSLTGGFGQSVNEYLKDIKTIRTLNIGLPDAFIEQGQVSELKTLFGLDVDSVTERIKKEWQTKS